MKVLPDDLFNLLTKDGDLGDGARYIFCDPLDDEWGLDDVGVEGREFEPEGGTFLVAGEVEREEEVPVFLIVGGVKADTVFTDEALDLAALGDEHVVVAFVSVFNEAPAEAAFSESLLFAASWEEDPSFRLDGGVRLDSLTPPIFFSPPSCFLRISRISGEVYLSVFL